MPVLTQYDYYQRRPESDLVLPIEISPGVMNNEWWIIIFVHKATGVGV
jgi:hypothetical protein